ncbi:MAG: hypothetical protein J2P27_00680 [Actinobacteria bacterium]|nr:hypothetical protein [Actinomycetota bacterium]
MLKAGNRHQAVIYYSFRGDRVGMTYYVAGLRLRYRVGSSQQTVTFYQVGIDCVVARDPDKSPACNGSAAAMKAFYALSH